MNLSSGFVNNTIICNEKKDVDLDALNFIAFGSVKELCQCSYKNENKHHHFIYDTDGLVSLAELKSTFSFEDVIELLNSSSEMIQALNKNGLVLDNVKNAKEYIMKSVSEYRFVYIPIKHKESISVKEFITKLISVVHYKDIRLTQFAKDLKKKKNDEESLSFLNSFVSSYKSIQSVSDEATSLLSDEGATSLLSDEGSTSLLSDDGATSLLSDDGATSLLSESELLNENSDDLITDDDKESVLDSGRLTAYFQDESGEYETTVLAPGQAMQSQSVKQVNTNKYRLYLIRSLNGEKITIDVTPFTIGKDTTNMDFVLNNDSVSRHHATIVYENGDYFIMDNNSTNGTTIEGVRLQFGEKGDIDNGYIISLGNESFQAYIERR